MADAHESESPARTRESGGCGLCTGHNRRFLVLRKIYILHQAGVFWAQYGYSGSRIAALNGTVAVLITRWVHDDFVTPSLGLLPRFKMLEVTYHAAGM